MVNYWGPEFFFSYFKFLKILMVSDIHVMIHKAFTIHKTLLWTKLMIYSVYQKSIKFGFNKDRVDPCFWTRGKALFWANKKKKLWGGGTQITLTYIYSASWRRAILLDIHVIIYIGWPRKKRNSILPTICGCNNWYQCMR